MKPIRESYWKINSVLAASYFLLGVLCSRISGGELLVPVLFLPEGVSLAAALFFGWRCALGVFSGQLALALFNEVSLAGALSVASVNALEVVLAAQLARRWGISSELSRFNDYVKFALLIIFVLQPFSALVSNLLLGILGQMPSFEAYWDVVILWWSANVLAQLLITPALLTLLTGESLLKDIKPLDVLTVLMLPLLTLGVFVIEKSDLSVVIALLLPMTLLAAYKIQLGLFSISAAVSAFVASLATSYGIGPFVQYAPHSYTHLNVLFFGTFIPAQLICLLFKEVKLEKKHVLDLSEERIRFLTYFDSLTGLPNRQLAESLLLPAMEDSGSIHQDCAVVLIDLDDFKLVNEVHGQQFGDALLIEAVSRIKSCLRPNDHLCRIGGDEFLAILPNLESRSVLNSRVDAIMLALSGTVVVKNRQIQLNASCGIVTIRPREHVAPEVIINNAEVSLLAAKRDGKNNHKHYTPLVHESAAQFSSLTEGLHFALDRNELMIHFQPQVDLSSEKIVGVEALLRWQAPGLGVFSPSSFIAIAERSGLIVPIGAWVIRAVCKQIAQWKNRGLPTVMVTINISVKQIERSDVCGVIQSALNEYGIDPSQVCLEVTESALLEEDKSISRFIHQIGKMGVNLAIDDFGTGFSNLTNIRRLKVNRIKIDKAFVQSIVQSETDRNIVKSVIDLANGINAIAVAEGVEDEATTSMLKSLGCQQAQGYYFARPMSALDFEQRIMDGSNTSQFIPSLKKVEDSVLSDTQTTVSGEKFQLLFEHAPIGMALVDHATGGFKDVNQVLLDWTGYTKTELLNLSYWDITPRTYEAQELVQIEELNRTGRFGPNNKEYIRKDGSRFPIRISGFKTISETGAPLVWGLIEKLDALPGSLEAKPSVTNLDHLNILFDAVCMVDESGRFVYVSQAAERIFGYAPEEMMGKPMIDFVYPEDREQTLSVAGRVMTGDFVNHFENRYLRKDGRVVDILWSARWSNTDRLRVAVARDITERKRNETRLLAMYNISEAANQAFDLGAFLKKIFKIIATKYVNSELMIVLYDSGSHQLRICEIPDSIFDNSADKIQVPETLCKAVIKAGEIIRLEGEAVKIHPDYASLSVGMIPEVVMAIPMSESGNCHGVLILREFQGVRNPAGIDDEFLVYTANQIALVIERFELQEALRQKALYDELTRLPNRGLFNDRLVAAMNHVKRDHKKLALIYFDINNFKWINDTYGHLVGDLLLKMISDRLSGSIRASDTVARIGGDEFVCLLDGDLDSNDVAKLAAKIRKQVDGPAVINGYNLEVSVSVGWAIYPDQAETTDALMSLADHAMYADKARIKSEDARKTANI